MYTLLKLSVSMAWRSETASTVRSSKVLRISDGIGSPACSYRGPNRIWDHYLNTEDNFQGKGMNPSSILTSKKAIWTPQMRGSLKSDPEAETLVISVESISSLNPFNAADL